jgi:ATP-dependent exoDNAse (exonuclease V) alpha subunit
MLRRNLIYTGVTRGKRLVVLAAKSVGDSGQEFASPAQMVKTQTMATWRSRTRGVNNARLFRLG